MASSGSEEENESEILQELYACGKLKPGLNYAVEKKVAINDIEKLKLKLSEIKNDLPWSERLDLTNDCANLAPELYMELNEQTQLVKSGRVDSLAFNEFKRETLFHRQAQLAVLEGIARLRSQGIPTLRPDDYLAEMMKTDEHMQKVKHLLLQKQAGLERSEKIKKIRAEKKLKKAEKKSKKSKNSKQTKKAQKRRKEKKLK